MPPTKVHIIHVGTMSNMGTQALLESDVSTLKEIIGNDAVFSVSTTDEEGVKTMPLPLEAVVPTLVDIPFRKADILTKRLGIERTNPRYKALVLLCMIYMCFQVVFSILSSILVKVKLKPLYRTEVFRHMSECDLVISCSDENFREVAALIPSTAYWVITWWSILFERTLEILTARFLGKPIVMLPNSVGPFRTYIGRFLSRLSLNNCSAILIRDTVSYEVVRSLGIRPPKILTSDIALLFKSIYTPRFTRDKDANESPVVGVAAGVYSHTLTTAELRDYIKEHALALDMVIERLGAQVIFLPHYVTGFQYDDLEISDLILQNMKNKDRVRIICVDNVREFKSLLDQMSVIVSSKMHPAVLGASGYVPTLCIAYDNKQIGFFRDMGMSKYVIRIREISHEKMASKISHLWEERETISAMLRKKVPLMQENLRKSIEKVISPYLRS